MHAFRQNRRRRAAALTAAKPANIIAQVPGSGTTPTSCTPSAVPSSSSTVFCGAGTYLGLYPPATAPGADPVATRAALAELAGLPL